jgi:hypothetical protein
MAAVISTLLALVLAYSAIRKLSHRPDVVRTYVRVGVPEERLDLLAFTLLAGAAGLLAGLVWELVGVAAAAATAVYFAVAIAAHLRADDAQHVATPLVIELVAVTVLVLRLAG